MRLFGQYVSSVALAALVLLLGMACATQPVKSNFAADPTYGEGPLTVQFSDKSGGEIESWAWDFDGGGAVDSGDQNPTFVYSSSGSYDISLTVTGAGQTDTTTKTYYIDLD